MKTLLRILSVCVVLLSIGCSSILYGPDTNRLESAAQEGEIKFNSGVTLRPRFYSYSADLSYSPKNNLGTQLFLDYGDKYKALGVGFGYYFTKNKNGEKKAFQSNITDIYLAYSYNTSTGIGSGSRFEEYRYDYKFQDVSVQLGKQFYFKNVGISLGIRPHLIDVISADIYGNTELKVREAISNLNDDPFFITDLLGKLSFGSKSIKFYVGGSISTTPQKISDLYDPISISTGFNFNLSQLVGVSN